VSPRPPRRLSIFARTFLLLVGALVLAQGLGVALILLRTPIFDVPVHPPEVVALLGTQMPAADARLQVHTQPAMPQPDAHQHREPRIEAVMARWLGVPADNVRFYSGLDPFGDGERFMPPGPPDFGGHRPTPGSYPPGGNPWRRGPGPDFIAGKNQLDGFTAAARQADGRWRVVSSPGRRLSGAFKLQVVLLFGAGLLLMLPLAWWFSRALSAPIRRFSEAADRLGRHPDAAPLSPQGPTELAQAVDSFNTMQARLSRMVHERTQMVAAIAHDLRTPLARLAFRMESVPAPLRERVMADIDEMKRMISAALDFIRNAQRPGPRALLDFRLLAEGVVDDLADIGAEAQLAPGESILLEGDPMGLRRMVANLCENALKYGGNARLSLQREDGHCVLWIDDDGPGIDPAQREQLLLPFVRGESSRNRDTGGIGLGLAVANGIATAHGGELSLDNRAEGGLRASVRLPCLPASRLAQ